MNLRTKKVDSKDEYMMMRLAGVMDGLIPDVQPMEDEEISWLYNLKYVYIRFDCCDMNPLHK